MKSRTGIRARRSKGLTLIEVLVALIVLSIGILGLATLQTQSLSFNNAASQRSQATALAYDMADKMRANRPAALNGDYFIAFQDPAPACAAPNLVGTVAAQDISMWRMALACRLPDATGSIAPVAGGNQITLTVRWDDSNGTQPPLLFQLTTVL